MCQTGYIYCRHESRKHTRTHTQLINPKTSPFSLFQSPTLFYLPHISLILKPSHHFLSPSLCSKLLQSLFFRVKTTLRYCFHFTAYSHLFKAFFSSLLLNLNNINLILPRQFLHSHLNHFMQKQINPQWIYNKKVHVSLLQNLSAK